MNKREIVYKPVMIMYFEVRGRLSQISASEAHWKRVMLNKPKKGH